MSTTLATQTAYNATLSHNGSVASGLGQRAVELPECVALCIRNELPKATCNSANSTCICTSESLNNAIGACVKDGCTIIEALQGKKIHSLSCGEPVRRDSIQMPFVWSMFVVTLIAVAARLFAKTPLVNPTFTFSWDDCCILASLAAITAVDTGTKISIDLGFGQDIWMISPDQVTQILCIFFFSEIMYAIILLVSWPVSYNWTFWDGRHTGRRGHVKIFSFVNGGINIALDLSLCVLPVTQFINMSWTLKTKIRTSLIFLFSLIVTVSSCIRLETLTKFGDSRNPTFELKGVAICLELEDHHHTR
ncbi:hypothetical protein CH35J_004606 [Colletotrichum higginsianum]|uniref:CFEM domain-containing protein n=1 Tax=Colletotrichum higginsianum TaxID=80884 RepID=A0A4T0W9L8_9PEZI|nr:hypothetical protein CH35J_004606 [Colletotrichum higginsianum]